MLSEVQGKLVDLAVSHVRDFVKKRGAFSIFAIARQPDGKDQYLQSSEEFKSVPETFAGMFQVLMPLARDQSVEATAICTHLPDGKANFAIIDVETRLDGRCIVLLQFRKKMLGRWEFGEREYRKDTARVFVS